MQRLISDMCNCNNQRPTLNNQCLFIVDSNNKAEGLVTANQNDSSVHETSQDLVDEYYNFTQLDKRSATAIMLEDLADFVLMGKTTSQRLEEQFDVM